VRRPDEADAAVLALPSGAALAVSIDGNGRRVACDPRAGAAEAVYECSANLACVGAEPLGLTNCLNFGNPEKPHVAWQLTEAVEGLARACEALEVPVVGGNVSLYNEAPTGPILPTPIVGMVGKLPDASRTGRIGFAQYGDAIALVGPFAPSLDGSEVAKLRGHAPTGRLPVMDPQAVRDAHLAVRDAVRSGALSSAHDISEGGLAVALAECAIAGGIGAKVRVAIDSGEEDLFGEAPGAAFVVSGPEPVVSALGRVIGRVGGDTLIIAGKLEVAVSELRAVRDGGLVEYASSAVWSE
jgi:phosphoribosylformylglycinamidine synthase